MVPPLLRFAQPLRLLLVLRSDSCPTLGSTAPTIIHNRHIAAPLRWTGKRSEDVLRNVIGMSHKFVLAGIAGPARRHKNGKSCEKRRRLPDLAIAGGRRKSGLQYGRRRFGRCEEADQSSRGVRLSGLGRECPCEGNIRLELGRNRADESNTRDVYQLTDLLKANLRLAACDYSGYRLAGWRPAYLSTLAGHLVGHAAGLVTSPDGAAGERGEECAAAEITYREDRST